MAIPQPTPHRGTSTDLTEIELPERPAPSSGMQSTQSSNAAPKTHTQMPSSETEHMVSSKVEEIAVRREAERKPLVSPPVVFDENGSFHYHRHEDATAIELFYDLFFVANLANLTEYSAISSRASLSQYIGWFSVIWTTWFQVSMFDVRFGSDSVIFRLFKVVQFCAMIALACESANFVPHLFNEGDELVIASFRIIDYILLISRATLVLMYSVPLIYMLKRRQRNLILPLTLCCTTFLISVIIYASILPTFSKERYHEHAYRAWYVILAFEVASIMAISSIWRVVSFKNTHVVKRMGLLTLIILGEGVLNTAKELSNTAHNTQWSPSAFGQALIAVLVIVSSFWEAMRKVRRGCLLANVLAVLAVQYMIWDLYFGKIPQKHIGTVKQQIYTVLHYPFHLALALVLEGQILWTKVNNVERRAIKLFTPANEILSSNETEEVMAEKLNETFYSILEEVEFKDSFSVPVLESAFNATHDALLSNNETALVDALNSVITFVYHGLLTDEDIELDEETTVDADNYYKTTTSSIGGLNSEAFSKFFGVSFIYYLVCAGVVLIMLACFRWLVLKKKDIFDRIAIFNRVMLGLLLCGLSLMILQDSGVLVDRYTDSGWFLATFLLSLGAAIEVWMLGG